MECTPWHLWTVGILSLLLNAVGAWDYLASQMKIEGYLDMLTPEQLAFFDAIPAWAVGTWAIAFWGSVLGSILILMQRGLAVPVLVISFGAMALTAVQNFLLSDVSMIDIMGAGAAIFLAVIFIVGLLLVWYASVQRRAGG